MPQRFIEIPGVLAIELWVNAQGLTENRPGTIEAISWNWVPFPLQSWSWLLQLNRFPMVREKSRDIAWYPMISPLFLIHIRHIRG